MNKSGFKMCLYLLLAGGLLLNCSMATQDTSAESLMYITEHYPPYNYQENGELKGISVDLLELIFDNMNTGQNKSEISLLIWAEGYNATLHNENTVLFSTARLPKREELFKWAGPIISINEVILSKKDLKIETVEDLKGYRIGVIRNSAPAQMLLYSGLDEGDLVLEDESQSIINMLENESLDAWACGELPGLWLIEEANYNPQNYKTIYVIGERELYYAFNKNTSDELVQSFQSSFEYVKMNRSETGISKYEEILYKYVPVRYSKNNVSDEQIVQLVDLTASNLENNSSLTLAQINAGKPPYKDENNPEIYIFVFDSNVVIVGHADNPMQLGHSFKGKSDVSGYMFRDEILEGALKNGSGWVDYIYINPVQSGLYYKTAYYKLAMGSDGKEYIVGCGKYDQ